MVFVESKKNLKLYAVSIMIKGRGYIIYNFHEHAWEHEASILHEIRAMALQGRMSAGAIHEQAVKFETVYRNYWKNVYRRLATRLLQAVRRPDQPLDHQLLHKTVTEIKALPRPEGYYTILRRYSLPGVIQQSLHKVYEILKREYIDTTRILTRDLRLPRLDERDIDFYDNHLHKIHLDLAEIIVLLNISRSQLMYEIALGVANLAHEGLPVVAVNDGGSVVQLILPVIERLDSFDRYDDDDDEDDVDETEEETGTAAPVEVDRILKNTLTLNAGRKLFAKLQSEMTTRWPGEVQVSRTTWQDGHNDWLMAYQIPSILLPRQYLKETVGLLRDFYFARIKEVQAVDKLIYAVQFSLQIDDRAVKEVTPILGDAAPAFIRETGRILDRYREEYRGRTKTWQEAYDRLAEYVARDFVSSTRRDITSSALRKFIESRRGTLPAEIVKRLEGYAEQLGRFEEEIRASGLIRGQPITSEEEIAVAVYLSVSDEILFNIPEERIPADLLYFINEHESEHRRRNKEKLPNEEADVFEEQVKRMKAGLTFEAILNGQRVLSQPDIKTQWERTLIEQKVFESVAVRLSRSLRRYGDYFAVPVKKRQSLEKLIPFNQTEEYLRYFLSWVFLRFEARGWRYQLSQLWKRVRVFAVKLHLVSPKQDLSIDPQAQRFAVNLLLVIALQKSGLLEQVSLQAEKAGEILQTFLTSEKLSGVISAIINMQRRFWISEDAIEKIFHASDEEMAEWAEETLEDADDEDGDSGSADQMKQKIKAIIEVHDRVRILQTMLKNSLETILADQAGAFIEQLMNVLKIVLQPASFIPSAETYQKAFFIRSEFREKLPRALLSHPLE
jgi:hypothetical protein